MRRKTHRQARLVALRELAVRQTAHAAETRHAEEGAAPATRPTSPLAAQDRLLIVIEPTPASAVVIRRGRRVADYLRADCLAVYVSKTPDLRDLQEDERDTLQRQLNFARGLQVETRTLEGEDVAETLVSFARRNGVTQIFVPRQKDSTLRSWLTEGLVQRIVNLAQDMQVTVVADRSVWR